MREIIEKDIKVIEELKEKLFQGQEIKNIERLGGLTNHSYHVTLSTDDLVFRLPGEGTEELINRQDEKIATDLASSVDVDSTILYFDEKGIKISKFIENAITMSPESLRTDENIKLIAEAFTKLHKCGVDTKVLFDIIKVAEDYERFIIKNNVKLFNGYETYKSKVKNFMDEYHLDYKNLVPCHNDSLCENWIRSNDRIFLIDWEYAGMNDAMWDLADVSIEANYSLEEDNKLLNYYSNNNTTQEMKERFIANKVFIDYLWSLWGLTRVPFEKTMTTYAENRYERMKENIKKLEELK